VSGHLIERSDAASPVASLRPGRTCFVWCDCPTVRFTCRNASMVEAHTSIAARSVWRPQRRRPNSSHGRCVDRRRTTFCIKSLNRYRT